MRARIRNSPDTACRGNHARRSRSCGNEEVGTVVLQSETIQLHKRVHRRVGQEIKNHHDIAVTLSLGDRELDDYAYWRECGADRCLVKLETTDPELYSRFRMGEAFSERLNRVETLRDLGYEVGSGIIVGLPGMTLETTLKDILFSQHARSRHDCSRAVHPASADAVSRCRNR